jgi:hypothetical protein
MAERSGWGAEKPPSPAGGVVDLWDLGTGERIRRLAEWLTRDPYYRPATMAAFTADGRVVLAPGTGTVPAQGVRPGQPSDGAAALLDPLTPRRLRSFAGGWHYYTAAIALSPDGRTLYLSFDTSEIVAFEVATGGQRRTVHGHAGCVRSLAMAREGRHLLSGSDDAFALLWDTTPAGAAKPRKEPLTEDAADELWAALAGSAANRLTPRWPTWRPRRTGRGAPAARAETVARRPDRLRARPHFRRPGWRGLYHTREGVTAAGGWGELAVPGVRKRLAKAESAEVRRRALHFLDRFDPATLKPDRLHQLRAVELLEGIATPAAADVLSELAKGSVESPLTREAAAALERLRRQGRTQAK